MANPTKAFPIDPTGRVLITEAADKQVATKQLTVGDTVVELTTNTTGMKRRKLFVRNAIRGIGTEVIVYLGDANVTSASGFPLYQFDEIELDIDVAAGVYAIAAIDDENEEIHILELE